MIFSVINNQLSKLTIHLKMLGILPCLLLIASCSSLGQLDAEQPSLPSTQSAPIISNTSLSYLYTDITSENASELPNNDIKNKVKSSEKSNQTPTEKSNLTEQAKTNKVIEKETKSKRNTDQVKSTNIKEKPANTTSNADAIFEIGVSYEEISTVDVLHDICPPLLDQKTLPRFRKGMIRVLNDVLPDSKNPQLTLKALRQDEEYQLALKQAMQDAMLFSVEENRDLCIDIIFYPNTLPSNDKQE